MVLVLIVKQLATKLSVLVPRHIQETLLSLVVHLPRLTSAIPTPVAPMPSVSQEWTILQGRTGLCASVRMATEVSIKFKFMSSTSLMKSRFDLLHRNDLELVGLLIT